MWATPVPAELYPVGRRVYKTPSEYHLLPLRTEIHGTRHSSVAPGGDFLYLSSVALGGDILYRSSVELGGDILYRSSVELGGDILYRSSVELGGDFLYRGSVALILLDSSYNSL